MEIDINIEEIEAFITSEKFSNFLLSNTTEFGTCAFILQTLLDKIEEIKSEED